MPLLRSQIVRQLRPGDPPRDFTVNTVYHTNDDSGFNPSVDYDSHADEIMTLFRGLNTTTGSTFQLYAQNGLTVKVYDMADAKPRVPRSVRTYVPSSWPSQALAPRQLAACLSFYGNNPGIKWQRGRIFIGPWNMEDMAYTVASVYRDMIADLGHGLFDIGGENVAHVVHSVTHNANTPCQHYWCNDVWDTMRSREQREAARKLIAP